MFLDPVLSESLTWGPPDPPTPVASTAPTIIAAVVRETKSEICSVVGLMDSIRGNLLPETPDDEEGVLMCLTLVSTYTLSTDVTHLAFIRLLESVNLAAFVFRASEINGRNMEEMESAYSMFVNAVDEVKGACGLEIPVRQVPRARDPPSIPVVASTSVREEMSSEEVPGEKGADDIESAGHRRDAPTRGEGEEGINEFTAESIMTMDILLARLERRLNGLEQELAAQQHPHERAS